MGMRDGELKVVIQTLQQAVSLQFPSLPLQPASDQILGRRKRVYYFPYTYPGTRPAQPSPRSGPSSRGGGSQASPAAGLSPLHPITPATRSRRPLAYHLLIFELTVCQGRPSWMPSLRTSPLSPRPLLPPSRGYTEEPGA